MPAFFTCKSCGQEHASPLFFLDEKSFAIAHLGRNTFCCPVTSKTADYEKKHMFWLKGDTRKELRVY